MARASKRAAPALTERDLLAAPAGDYMSLPQLAYFKRLLQAQRQALFDSSDDTRVHLREDTEVFSDPNDRASLEEELSVALRVRDRERKLVGKIDAALARIEDGSYGWCVETGEPIGIARLLARPQATLCLEAQERRELRETQFNR